MTDPTLRLVSLADLDDAAAQRLECADALAVNVVRGREAEEAFAQHTGFDALIVDAHSDAAVPRRLAPHSADRAVLVVADDPAPDAVLEWLQLGVQDILSHDDLHAPNLPLRVRAAIERKRHERQARTAYATDLSTGLPHQQQLIEHMSHLLALREREPAPMAVLVLRIEGLATTQARHGAEAANALRRKIAVRLRAGVRASDVVASLGEDCFAVLLASILAPADAQRVGAKLLTALQVPLRVGGQDLAVAAALGVALFPGDGKQPDALLRRALGLAASAQAQGRAGLSNFVESGAVPGAANDP